METKTTTVPALPQKQGPSIKEVLAAAPSLHEVLAKPMVYEAWLKKAQEALNG